jgi:hypothetical protein
METTSYHCGQLVIDPKLKAHSDRPLRTPRQRLQQKRGIRPNLISPSIVTISPPFFSHLPLLRSHSLSTMPRFSQTMAASHPHLFQASTTDESEICKLVANYFLPDRVVLQWHPATGEDTPTPNTNEIVVLSSFF